MPASLQDIVGFAQDALSLLDELLAGGATIRTLVLLGQEPEDLGYYVLYWSDSLGQTGRTCVVNGEWYEVRPIMTFCGPVCLLIPGPDVHGAPIVDLEPPPAEVSLVPEVVDEEAGS